MRCLFLFPFLPYPPDDGARVRMWKILSALARRNEIEVISLAEGSLRDEQAVATMRQAGMETTAIAHNTRLLSAGLRAATSRRSLYSARYVSSEFQRVLRERLRERRYDVVQCDFFYMGAYRPAREARADSALWILHEHNVEYELAASLASAQRGLRALPYRAYAELEARRRRREELSVCKRMDHVVTVTKHDRQVLHQALHALPVTVIPTGVDLDYFTPSTLTQVGSTPSGIFVGKMDYRPNIDAARWFCAKVLPLVHARLPDFVFKIVGPDPPASIRELETANVEVTGWVPDIRPHMREAVVVTAPLLAGSGIRVKILDALAMGKGVVSTSIGCQGIGVEDDVHLLIRDDPASFAEAVVNLILDSGRRGRLEREGRRFVERHYGWPALVDRVEDLYRELLDRRG
jgi:glycosyltransferase involved in cell wall biosynthesis